ncbi:hypothetical protein J2W21_000835 [Sinomonas atrocyanea]|uniref:DUF6492 family protein n=1 Tax=Sinomonas atrocyanea TaxID=37927 RepID=UPI00278477AB|nr:DUF6492 family protein [Sinomonas atrocyanea]MDP9883345.1 hypothetical protein [Sinomonas atrocyanea]
MDTDRIEIITPSYAADFALCAELSRSIQRWAGPGIQHRIITPKSDLTLFSALSSENTSVHDVAEYLSPALIKIPYRNVWINRRRVWPPVRGWIAQQLVKLAAAAASSAQAVVLADSDLVFIAPFEISDLLPRGAAVLYRQPGAVHAGLPIHRKWHESSCRLLNMEPPGEEALTDFVCWPCLWIPDNVRQLLSTVEAVSGRPWQTAIGGELFFSEMMLYGIFMERQGGVETTSRMLAATYSEETPLDRPALDRLLRSARDDVIAVMISAKSSTDIELRNRAIDDFSASRSSYRREQR